LSQGNFFSTEPRRKKFCDRPNTVFDNNSKSLYYFKHHTIIVTLPSHRFREMCEEEPAVQALGFLQNEVSSVVNHSNPKEAEIFRSLLTHLVMASPLDSLPTPDDEAPPRKKSRPNTPEAESASANGVTINGANGSMNGSTAIKAFLRPGINLGVDKEKLQSTVDPMEHDLALGSTSGLSDHLSGYHKPLSQKRFEQRNEVFESLLEFIAEEAKQPDEGLVDLMDFDFIGKE